MAGLVTVIVHERIGSWARQLRPRLARTLFRVRETRSASDLRRVFSSHEPSVLLVDLSVGPIERLADLHQCRDLVATALVLVLDPESLPGVAATARALGATLVRSGFSRPPDVAQLIERWGQLAMQRTISLPDSDKATGTEQLLGLEPPLTIPLASRPGRVT